jgi:hypothetical protein
MTIQVTKPSVNLREKLNELETNKGLKGNEILQAETAQEVRSLIGAGRKNLIINGDMQVSQRGDYTTATGVANTSYYLDRWKTWEVTTGHTLQQIVDGYSSNTNTQKVLVTTGATGKSGSYQRFEYATKLRGRELTFSAMVRSNSPNARLMIYASGAGWLGDAQYTGNGAWQKVTLNVTATTAITTLDCYVALSGDVGASIALATNDYIEFTEVQLELGSVATDFEHRSYGEELALCQRYYWLVNSGRTMLINNGTGTVIVGNIAAPVTMRGAGTLYKWVNGGQSAAFSVISGGSGTQIAYSVNAANVMAAAPGTQMMGFNIGSATTYPDGYTGWLDFGTSTNQLSIAFDAEL